MTSFSNSSATLRQAGPRGRGWRGFWFDLMIAYIALFSALLSRLTAIAWGSTSVTSFIARFLNIHGSGVLTALAWLVPHETAAVSAQILCTPYNHAPCHFMQSHIGGGRGSSLEGGVDCGAGSVWRQGRGLGAVGLGRGGGGEFQDVSMLNFEIIVSRFRLECGEEKSGMSVGAWRAFQEFFPPVKVNSDFQCVITDLSAKIWGMGCDGVGVGVCCKVTTTMT